MSAIGGILSAGWNEDDEKLFSSLQSHLRKNGPDEEHLFTGPGFRCADYQFNTYGNSRTNQPLHTAAGLISMVDGRLDNRDELLDELDLQISEIIVQNRSLQPAVEDRNSVIILAAYAKWGSRLIDHVIGDYFFSIVDTRKRLLVLGRDPAGTRPGYYHYRRRDDLVVWSSDLLPLAKAFGDQRIFDREYIAGYLTLSEPWERTPFPSIKAVIPGECLSIYKEGVSSTISSLQPLSSLPLQSDEEYEEQFVHLLTKAVKRRSPPNSVTTCELSGGLDSSSIICIAQACDSLAAQGSVFQTVSFVYDRSTSADETSFVKIVDEHLRKSTHFIEDKEILRPAAHYGAAPNPQQLFSHTYECLGAYMKESDSRVLLSGHAGDQVTFGTGRPMLSIYPDYLRQKGIGSTLTLLRKQAQEAKRPYFQMLLRCIAVHLLPAAINARIETDYMIVPNWIDEKLRRETDLARRKVCQPQARTIKNVLARQRYNFVINAISLAGSCFYRERLPIEIAFPFLDRDLVRFLLAVPISQLVRPDESSRSLMRRSLRGVLPEATRTRITKKGPDESITRALRSEWTWISQIFKKSYCAEYCIIDAKYFAEELARARFGVSANRGFLLRALSLEFWLRAWIGD